MLVMGKLMHMTSRVGGRKDSLRSAVGWLALRLLDYWCCGMKISNKTS